MAFAIILSTLISCAINKQPLRAKIVNADPCTVELEGMSFVLRGDSPVFMQELERLRDADRPVEISAAAVPPYRCVGSAVYSFQLAGFMRVDFIADPGTAE